MSEGIGTSQNSHPAPFEFAAIFGVGLLSLAFGRKSTRKGRVFMLICLLILTGAIASMTACSTKVLGTAPVLTTPTGGYSVMITAQQVGSIMVPGGNCPAANPDCITVYGSQNQISLPYTMKVTVQ
jgi:hypothetical protein